MKKLLICGAVLSLYLFSSCTTIDIVLNDSNAHKKMKKIAILPFNITDPSTNGQATWGNEFADTMIHQFLKCKRGFDVVERDALNKILKEKKMAMSGAVDTDQAVAIGKLLGADVIIFGNGTVLRHVHSTTRKSEQGLIDTFSFRVVSVEDAKILISGRKESGRAWDWGYRLKYMCCGLPTFTLFFDREDVLIDSSKYDDIAKQIVKKILMEIDEILLKK